MDNKALAVALGTFPASVDQEHRQFAAVTWVLWAVVMRRGEELVAAPAKCLGSRVQQVGTLVPYLKNVKSEFLAHGLYAAADQ